MRSVTGSRSDENRDLAGLCAADAAAGLSGTFVVNGSPTQTAMVEASGGASQLTHISTAATDTLVLLFFYGPLKVASAVRARRDGLRHRHDD